jgi:hypothetical protein
VENNNFVREIAKGNKSLEDITVWLKASVKKG